MIASCNARAREQPNSVEAAMLLRDAQNIEADLCYAQGRGWKERELRGRVVCLSVCSIVCGDSLFDLALAAVGGWWLTDDEAYDGPESGTRTAVVAHLEEFGQ
jgi:hypothetical protein